MKYDQRGGTGGLVIALLLVSVLAVGALVFAGWAYKGRQLYKNHADQLVSAAVSQAKESEAAAVTHQDYLNSLKTTTNWTGPPQYGSISVNYPKSWSGYVDATGGGGGALDAYFSPGVVTSTDQQGVNYPLRIEVTSDSYSDELQNYQQQQQGGGLSISPYAFPNVKSDIGVIMTGQITQNQQGTLVLVPLRTNALKIWTEEANYESLLTSQILPSVSFSP